MSTTTSEVTFVERSVEAEGFTVRYWEAGEGTPLVYLHPAGGPHWRPAHTQLAATYRVIQFEMPGWGSYRNDRASTLREQAELMAAIIAALGLDTYHLMGTSLGGAVAVNLATLFPERIISLVLDAPAAFRDGGTPPNQLTPEQLVRAFRTHPEREPQFEMAPPEAMARFWPFVEKLMGAPDDTLVERMSTCGVLTLVLFGTDDGVIPAHNGRTYRRYLSNSSLQYIYDAAHDAMGDRPDAWFAVVDDFLRRGMAFLVPDADTVLNP